MFIYGQTVPQGINYQAVALDQNGQPIRGVDIVGRPIVDAEIGVRLTILENSPTGMVLYQEEHEVLTDLYGMFNLVIGQGLQVSPDPFNSINWQGDKYLQVELSIDNNGSFTLSAVQQLMSVPYAFLAENALVAQTAIDVDDADADPTNELQGLSLSNDTLYLSNGGFVVLPTDQVNDADSDPTNELQILSLSNDTIYLTSGGFVVLPTDQVNDADDNPTNEIQTLSKTGSTISLTQGGNVTVFDGDYNALSNTPTIPTKTSDLTNDSGFITAEVDGSTTNEIQTLSKTGNTISLTQGGSVTVFDGDYNSLTSIPTLPTKTSDLTNDSGFITSEVDGSTTNEIQTLSKTGNTISLTQGGSVTVFDGDYNSLTSIPTLPTKTSDLTNDSGFITAEVDGSTTNELQVLTISNDTIFLSNGGFVKLPASSAATQSLNDLSDAISNQNILALGQDALNATTTATSNTAVGTSAMRNNTTGEGNAAMGTNAMYFGQTGSHNAAYGYHALQQNVAGSRNNAFGSRSMQSSTAGSDNNSFGTQALYQTTANGNNAFGNGALYGTTTGSLNNAFGYNALSSNSTGSSNTALGHTALSTNTTGSNNVAIGSGADVGSTNLSNAIAIGYGATVNASNEMQLGNDDLTRITSSGSLAIGNPTNTSQQYGLTVYGSTTGPSGPTGQFFRDASRNNVLTFHTLDTTSSGSIGLLGGTTNIMAIGAYNTTKGWSSPLTINLNATTSSIAIEENGKVVLNHRTLIKPTSDTTSINDAAALEVRSTTKGFLPPRMFEAERDAIATPPAGLIVYCSDCGSGGQIQFYNGTAWTDMMGGTAASGSSTTQSTSNTNALIYTVDGF